MKKGNQERKDMLATVPEDTRGIEMSEQNDYMSNLVIHEHGMLLVLSEPYPDPVYEMAENQYKFESKSAILEWLDTNWRGWRDQLVHSEGL